MKMVVLRLGVGMDRFPCNLYQALMVKNYQLGLVNPRGSDEF